MTDINIKLDDENIRSIMSEAILRALDTETRDALIREALAKLVLPTAVKGQWGREEKGPSIVTDAFGQAVSRIGRQVVADLVVNDPEIRAKAEALIRDTLLELMTRSDAAERIADALWTGINKAADR